MIKFVRLNFDPPQKEPEETSDKYDIDFINYLISKLNNCESTILQLYYYAGRSDNQISRILDIDKNTIYFTRKRATSKLHMLHTIFSNLPPHLIKFDYLTEKENAQLVSLYNTLRKPVYNRLKQIIAKIKDDSLRKTFTLLYNYNNLFKNKEHKIGEING